FYWTSFRKEKRDFSSCRQWWDHGKVLSQQLCQQYTANVTRDITKSLRVLEIEIVELQTLSEFTDHGLKELTKWTLHHSFSLDWKERTDRADSCIHYTQRTGSNDIRRYATNFYKDLYKSDYNDNKELLDVFYRGLPKVSPEDSAELEGPLVLEELQAALNSMAGGKAPGIHTAGSYKSFLRELGEDLLEVLRESCREMCLPLSSRRVVITLLPKKGDLQDIKNWCSVSLLCTDYKIMSKALANQLRDIMDSIIQVEQTFCVPNRSIIYNVSLIRDILDVSSSLAVDLGLISLDQEKAFDRVEHQYLWKTLEAFGLSPGLTAMMMYQDAESVLKINGELSAPF
ncbi:hypothetical protein QTP70_029443, partial [Hemibagrus guttatus]